jgi:hypothetical protein
MKAKRVLTILESSALVIATMAGWSCLRLDYWLRFFAHPADLGFRFAVQRLGVLCLFFSPLIVLLLYTRRIEPFPWKDQRTLILALTIGLTWVCLGWAVPASARADFLDWGQELLSAAGLGGLILTSAGIFLHRRLDKTWRRRGTENGPGGGDSSLRSE